MPSLYCPRCGLRTKLMPSSLLLENCPRCLARRGTVAPLVVRPSAPRAGGEVSSYAARATSPPTRT